MPIISYFTASTTLEGAGGDIQRADEVLEEAVDSVDQFQEMSPGAGIFVDPMGAPTGSPQPQSARAEMDSAAKDMRMVALRCQDMPEVTRETRLLRKTVSDGAKNIMSGLDSSSSQCHQELLDILDDGESSLVAGNCR